MNSISVFGASGHAKVILEIIEDIGLKVDHIFDEDMSKQSILGYEICHDLTIVERNTFVAIGNNSIRKKIVNLYNLSPPSIVHPNAHISKYSKIGIGSVVMAGVTINAESSIGKYCILNTNCSVDHDCLIGDYVHISPNACLAGNVQIGEGTHVGLGASIIQGVKIGKHCILGAGVVIVKDVPDYAVIVGNPGRIIKENKVNI